MKTKKASRKFAASGKLKQTIQARHKHQQLQKKIHRKKGAKGGGPKNRAGSSKGDATVREEEEDEEMEEEVPLSRSTKLDKGESDADDLDADEDEKDDSEEDDEDKEQDDDASFGSVDDLSDEGDGATHMMELSKLAEKDPEFYKYLQENDKELLEFNTTEPEAIGSDEEMETGAPSDEEDEEVATPILTADVLKGWQKALLEHRSLRALRRLLIAFRAAAYGNDEEATVAWTINNSAVFDKVVTTALKYTPVVLDHHIPYRTLPDGKYKPPLQSPKQQSLTKLLYSFFNSILHLLSQITDPQMVSLCLTESAKLVPYIVGNKKLTKVYLKTCLGFWTAPNVDKPEEEADEADTSAEDRVRIAAFLSMRKIAQGSDEALLDLVLKGCYSSLIRASRSTNVHSLPAINLMKNTAVDLYSINLAASYQHAFGYIRQLAITLRNTLKPKPTGPKDSTKDTMKAKAKEPHKQVYNWQFAHSIDFWSMLLSRACEGDPQGELQPLIYPLVQVSLGAVKLVSTPRYYPFHLQILRSLLMLSQHTRTYIPLPPYLLPVVTNLVAIGKPKASTLKPLDLDHIIRAPTSYLKTRVFIDSVVDEVLYLLAEWGANNQNSVAFPEVMLPVVLGLKRCLKMAKQQGGGGKKSGDGGKSVKAVKTLVERIEEGMEWTKEKRRNGISFGPNDREQVDRWETKVKIKDTPLGKYALVLKKSRERSRALLKAARQGEGEYLEQ